MIRVWLKHGGVVDLAAGVEVEPTLFPAAAGCDGRAALEVVDRDQNVVACFQTGEVAGYAFVGLGSSPEHA